MVSLKNNSKTRPLNILMLLSNAFDPDPRVHREALALSESGHKVTILCWDRDRKAKSEEVMDGIRLRRIHVDSSHGRGVAQMYFLAVFWAHAFAAGRKEKYDVVHAHDFDTLPLGYALARWEKAKLVYDSHESYVDMVHTLPKIIRQVIYHSENFLIKRANLVITVGDTLKEFLQRRGARRACVVGNWQDPNKFIFKSEALTEEKQRLGIRPEQLTIVFIANLGTERRVPELIQAVCQIPECYLVLGGYGPLADQAQNAADRYPNITYLGVVHPEKIPFYTALADVVFYGFDPQNPNARFSAPNKLFEALAAGKGVLTGDFGEIGRIVREMQCGVIMADYTIEHIHEAVKSLRGEKLQLVSSNARNAAETFYNWKMAEKTLLEQYQSL